eukprot:361670-Chlamydomonas_euryale.AAC.2
MRLDGRRPSSPDNKLWTGPSPSPTQPSACHAHQASGRQAGGQSRCVGALTDRQSSAFGRAAGCSGQHLLGRCACGPTSGVGTRANYHTRPRAQAQHATRRTGPSLSPPTGTMSAAAPHQRLRRRRRLRDELPGGGQQAAEPRRFLLAGQPHRLSLLHGHASWAGALAQQVVAYYAAIVEAHQQARWLGADHASAASAAALARAPHVRHTARTRTAALASSHLAATQLDWCDTCYGAERKARAQVRG